MPVLVTPTASALFRVLIVVAEGTPVCVMLSGNGTKEGIHVDDSTWMCW